MSFLREPDAEPLPGYRLIEPLGSGGFGEAWKCEAPGGIYKAIKFVFGNLNSLDTDGVRAEQELKALHRVKEIRHPFILSMDRIEIVGGELVIVMELADRNLHEVFEESVGSGLVGIPRDTLLRYIRDAAEALDHMHERHNLQHLDVKPRNLFLVSDRVKVADFGLVKHLERSGVSSMQGGVTPLYAPPETLSGTISGTTDQYSLAIVYMEMLTGNRPFNGKTVRALVKQHLEEEPDLRTVPESERAILGRALAKDPDKRFPNCLSFVRALFTCKQPTTGLPKEAQTPSMSDTMEDIFLEQSAEDSVPSISTATPVPSDKAPAEEIPVSHESQMGMTMALPETGSLRPTLILGLGEFGLHALKELRCRLVDRFGDLEKVPMFRFLYVDTDQESIRGALRSSTESVLTNDEVYHLPLQPISHYRKRQLEHLLDWLPREKLYAMPRSLMPQGDRALGRLAFSDNYLRLMARIRREIQEASHADTLYQSVTRTGLALRDGTPRVYLLVGGSGGSSGCLIDLGYALRRLLTQLDHADATSTLMLLCGSPDDPASPKEELANLYATLTELNHFTDPGVRFSSQYGADGPRLSEEGPAFDAIYLLPVRERTPENRQEVLARMGMYLCDELTTPLGLRLERCRQTQETNSGMHPFRSVGAFGVWFPRGLLLRQAAKSACDRLLYLWQQEEGEAPGSSSWSIQLEGSEADSASRRGGLSASAKKEMRAAYERVTGEPDLNPESLAASIGSLASQTVGAPPGEALTKLLGGLEEQSQQYLAQDDPESWTNQAIQRVQDWLGSGIHAPGNESYGSRATAQRKSRLTKGLEEAADELAQEWETAFMGTVQSLMELPGPRISLGEAALGQLIAWCDSTAATQQERIDQLSLRTDKARQHLENSLANCLSGSRTFWWFRGGIKRSLRSFMDNLAAFARQCLTEDLASAVHVFYLLLRGRLRDRLRDMALCRQRLRHLQEELQLDTLESEDPAIQAFQMQSDLWTTVGEHDHDVGHVDSWKQALAAGASRLVLPEGCSSLESSALSAVEGMNDEQWVQLDQILQEQVLSVFNGLFSACLQINDLKKYLVVPLISQAAQYLESQLPKTDVAEVEFSLREKEEGELADRVRSYFEHAIPLCRHDGAKSLEKAGQSATPHRDIPAVDLGWSDERFAREAEEEVTREAVYLLIPSSEAGKMYAEQAMEVIPHLQIVNAPNHVDLLFCREQKGLSTEELKRLMRTCHEAYRETVHVPQSSSHSRFDIQDWVPLEP